MQIEHEECALVMRVYSKWLFRISAIYAVIGALMGSDLAGRKDYTLVPSHAHILVVGWLTVFAYAIFYHVFKEFSLLKTAKLQAWSALIGGGLMPACMLFYYKNNNSLTTVLFIVSASVLLLAILLFAFLLFFDKKLFKEN